MKIILTDGHCHLLHCPTHIIHETTLNEIYTLVICDQPNQLDQLAQFPTLKGAYGIHPGEVEYVALSKLEEIISSIDINKLSAIGESGLDFSKYHNKTIEKQKEVFHVLLEFAEKNRLPINLHSRQAEAEVLSTLNNYDISAVYLHWWAGNKKQTNEAINCGYYIGITPSITYAKSTKRIVHETPLESLISESDAPVKDWSPSSTKEVIEAIAKIKDKSVEEVAVSVRNNLERYLNKLNSGKTIRQSKLNLIE